MTTAAAVQNHLVDLDTKSDMPSSRATSTPTARRRPRIIPRAQSRTTWRSDAWRLANGLVIVVSEKTRRSHRQRRLPLRCLRRVLFRRGRVLSWAALTA